jgi:hypothetical protein
MRPKGRENNKYNKITTIRLSRNYMTVEKVNIQRQIVTEYINIFGIIIQLNSVSLVKRRRKRAKQTQVNKTLNQGIYVTECN